MMGSVKLVLSVAETISLELLHREAQTTGLPFDLMATSMLS